VLRCLLRARREGLLDDHELTYASRRDGGVVVGEAAAFVLLGREGMGRAVSAWSRQGEADGTALRAQTIARALKDVAVTANLAGPSELTVMLDTNGRAERTKRWSFAQTRVLGTRKIMAHKIEPASFLGDVGVATLPLYLGLAARLSPSPTLIAATHGFGEAAGLVLLSKVER
jgi:hypothetical protein